MLTRGIIIMVLLALFWVPGCENESSTEDFLLEETKLKIACVRDLEAIPLMLGEKNDLFHEEGVQLEVQKFNQPSKVLDLVRSGAVDGVITGKAEAVKLYQEGFLVKITSQAAGNYKLVTAPGSGIETVQELEGSSVATVSTYTGRQATEFLLEKGDLSPQAVEIKETGSLDELPEVDAYVLPSLSARLWESRGGNLLCSGTQNNRLSPVIVFTGEALKEEKDNIHAFYRGYRRSLQLIKEKKEEEKPPSEIDTGHRGASLLDMDYPSCPVIPEKGTWRDMLNWMHNSDLLEREFSFEEIIEERFVERGEG